ncbi:hypothetical protein Hanom_Chr11g00971591 [Helianthus anomalus]
MNSLLISDNVGVMSCTYVVVYVCMCKDMYECMHVCKVVRKVCMYVEEYVRM